MESERLRGPSRGPFLETFATWEVPRVPAVEKHLICVIYTYSNTETKQMQPGPRCFENCQWYRNLWFIPQASKISPTYAIYFYLGTESNSSLASGLLTEHTIQVQQIRSCFSHIHPEVSLGSSKKPATLISFHQHTDIVSRSITAGMLLNVLRDMSYKRDMCYKTH